MNKRAARKPVREASNPVRAWMMGNPEGQASRAVLDEADGRLTVAFVLLPEFTLLAFSGFIEALRHAADEGDRSRQIYCQWDILGPSLEPVRASCGVEIRPRGLFADPAEYDYVVVVGGLTSGHRKVAPAIIEYLRLAAARGVKLVGLCTGSFILARAGLLDGHRCCVHWYHVEEFEGEFPKVRTENDKLYQIDGNFITCAGGIGVIDLAIELIEREVGHKQAMKAVTQMVLDEARRYNHPQSRLGRKWYLKARNPMVRRAVLLMQHHVSGPLSIAKLASRLDTSERKLERLFIAEFGVSPVQLSATIRLNYAQWLLEHTSCAITKVATDCGFSDASYFTKCFRREFGHSPSALRRRRLPLTPPGVAASVRTTSA